MDYQDCADRLTELYGYRPEEREALFRNLPALLGALGHPERELRGMLVVGTNGKGSTSAFAVSALTSTGARAGSMPSPHLQEPRERIRVNGVPVTREEYTAAFTEVREAIGRHGLPVTASGMCSATAAAHFRRAGVELAVAEASIGGRWAAARFLDLDVKVVTGIALDHTELLGDSLALIAEAKVGVVRDGEHAVLGRIPPEAAEAAERMLAKRAGLSVWRMDQEIRYTVHPAPDASGPLVDVTTPRAVHRGLPCPLPGAHQHHNLALAVAAVDALADRGHVQDLDDERLRRALAATRWPGRLELLTEARLDDWTARVLLDGATNPQGVATVAPEILRQAERGSGRTVLVFAAMRGKDVDGMLAPLPEHWPVVITRTGAAEAADPDALRARLAPGRRTSSVTAPDAAAALRRAAELAGPDGLIVVLGSLRLVGETRTALGLPPA
ncbi:bifunctional folylpolyglutamate synthase/dihydrofolate synthase [Kitasatospora sp. NPDC001175]|uniref:bifunctional folylpolyglutamate synthase/dihydrofolate synthase n=1 Tax=Kitasatospora sp. NPDC001175 TaxID=3157103 RepID=UPI003D00291A